MIFNERLKIKNSLQLRGQFWSYTKFPFKILTRLGLDYQFKGEGNMFFWNAPRNDRNIFFISLKK